MKIFILLYRYRDGNFTYVYDKIFYSRSAAEDEAVSRERDYGNVEVKIKEIKIKEAGGGSVDDV